MDQSIDQKLGSTIKQLRLQRGLSQMELAERMGVSFQQIQKYEKGITKIYVTRLRELADALNVGLDMFTSVIEEISCVSDTRIGYTPGKTIIPQSLPLNKEEGTLLKFFRKIKSEKLRKRIIKLLQDISELEDQD